MEQNVLYLMPVSPLCATFLMSCPSHPTGLALITFPSCPPPSIRSQTESRNQASDVAVTQLDAHQKTGGKEVEVTACWRWIKFKCIVCVCVCECVCVCVLSERFEDRRWRLLYTLNNNVMMTVEWNEGMVRICQRMQKNKQTGPLPNLSVYPLISQLLLLTSFHALSTDFDWQLITNTVTVNITPILAGYLSP